MPFEKNKAEVLTWVKKAWLSVLEESEVGESVV